MAHPNEDLVRTAYEAFGTGDMATILGLWTDDVVWHAAGDNPLSGDHAGKEAAAGYLAGLAQRTGGTFRAQLQYVLCDDDVGFSLHTSSATKDGEDMGGPAVIVYEFDDGKVKELWTFSFDGPLTDRMLA